MNYLIKKMLIINPEERIPFNEYYNNSFFPNNNFICIICKYFFKEKKEHNLILNCYEEIKRNNKSFDGKRNEKEIN